jgi:iron-regulated transporter 1
VDDNNGALTNDDDDDATTEWAVIKVARRLYVSHLLSTWNSGVFEFGSVLYLAAICRFARRSSSQTHALGQ